MNGHSTKTLGTIIQRTSRVVSEGRLHPGRPVDMQVRLGAFRGHINAFQTYGSDIWMVCDDRNSGAVPDTRRVSSAERGSRRVRAFFGLYARGRIARAGLPGEDGACPSVLLFDLPQRSTGGGPALGAREERSVDRLRREYAWCDAGDVWTYHHELISAEHRLVAALVNSQEIV